MTDIEIARSYKPLPIQEIAKRVGLSPEELYPYGRYKGKVALSALDRLKRKPQGRYILVTAINPTPLGEGKTTTSIGLAMGLCRIGQRALVTLRQPSLGPVFGIKGGGTGGGHAQVVPMEEINLHFTGDAHAVSASHNLLSAFIDNHMFHGNALSINPGRLTWPRSLGVSDRALREITLNEGADHRTGQFVITEASEVMAILALSSSQSDLQRRCGSWPGRGLSPPSVQAFSSCRVCRKNQLGRGLDLTRRPVTLSGCPSRSALLEVVEEF